MRVREREVVREHREQHRQRHVVVVHRPLLAARVGGRIGVAAGLLRADQLPVRRDDDEEDVRDHDRPEHRADLQVRRTRREQLRAAVRSRGDEHEHASAERRVAPQGAAEQVVDEPADSEQRDARRNRYRGRDVRDARVDQVGARLQVVERDEEREAGEPRRVRLPLVPVQRLRDSRRRDAKLLDPVETAAVDLPRLAGEVVTLLGRPQVVVERDEVERRADPDHRRDHVQEAEREVEPVDQVRVYREDHRSLAIATSSCSAVSSSSSRVRCRRSRSTGTSSSRERPFTKTMKRKPNVFS